MLAEDYREGGVSMMENRRCPICGKQYSGCAALSRTDNKTLICPDCGTAEAIAEFYAYIMSKEVTYNEQGNKGE